MAEGLKPCPCGQTPTRLGIVDNGQGGKWAAICTDCCGEWSIEFHTDYKPLDSPECMALAVEVWNSAPRGPCHEPEPAKDTQRTDPPNCDWHRDEFGNWFSGCSDTMPDFTPWKGTDPKGSFCPKCGKIITVRVHDKP